MKKIRFIGIAIPEEYGEMISKRIDKFLDPEDETAEEDGFSIAVRKDGIEDVASGENNYVLDGDNHATNMSQEEAQSILNQI